MFVISREELDSIKKQLNFYDFDKLNSVNGELRIKFKNEHEIIRFHDIEYGGSPEKFLQQAELLKKLLHEIISHFYAEIIIAKYEVKWFAKSNLVPEIRNIFQINKLRSNFSGAIKAKRPSSRG